MTSSSPCPLLLGHRGARRQAPENTLAAFDLALQQGCDGFEFDVRLTRDARALICHNPRLGRLSVARSTYHALCRGRLRRAGAGAQPASVLPCLDDVLERYAGRAYLDIELKVRGLEEFIVQALRQTPAREFIVSSFFPPILRELRARDSALPIGFITDHRRSVAAWERLDAEVGLQALIAHRRLVSSALIGEVHAAGKQIFVWTVNRPRQMLRLAEMDVDAVISDDTELLRGTLRAHR